jgi:hypothetical protein
MGALTRTETSFGVYVIPTKMFNTFILVSDSDSKRFIETFVETFIETLIETFV